MTVGRLYAALAAGIVLLAALLGALAWWVWEPGGQALRGDPIVVSSLLEPQQHLFGDAVRAQVEVAVDRERIDPDSVAVSATFTPYRELRAPRRTRSDAGKVTKLRFDYLVDCLTSRCLPQGQGRVDFTPATVTYRRRKAAAPESSTIEWPPIRSIGRIPSQRLWSAGLRGEFRDMPPPDYRFSPTTVELFALLLAILFAAAAAILTLRLLPLEEFAARLGIGDNRSALERALALVRESTRNGRPDEGRRALERLARELRRADSPELARDASRLAWSSRAPADAVLDPLSRKIERLIAEAS